MIFRTRKKTTFGTTPRFAGFVIVAVCLFAYGACSRKDDDPSLSSKSTVADALDRISSNDAEQGEAANEIDEVLRYLGFRKIDDEEAARRFPICHAKLVEFGGPLIPVEFWIRNDEELLGLFRNPVAGFHERICFVGDDEDENLRRFSFETPD